MALQNINVEQKRKDLETYRGIMRNVAWLKVTSATKQ